VVKLPCSGSWSEKGFSAIDARYRRTRLGFVIFAGNADEVKRDLWRYVFGIDLRAAW
jgi:hypothetical protein